MAWANLQRLADCGRLPKNYIKNKLYKKNIEILTERVKELEKDKSELIKQLDQFTTKNNKIPVRKNPLKSNSKSDEGFEKVDILSEPKK